MFLSSSIVVVVMFLLPMRKVYIPSFERKMTVKELLNVVSNNLGRVVLLLESKSFPVSLASKLFSSNKGFCNLFN